jgi:hypothetical protein
MWRSVPGSQATQYAAQQLFGLTDSRVVAATGDTIFIIGRGVLLYSPDGGRKWSKRLFARDVEYPAGLADAEPAEKLFLEGTDIWILGACRVFHSIDVGARWGSTHPLPHCQNDVPAGEELPPPLWDPRYSGKLDVTRGKVRVWTSNQLYEWDATGERWEVLRNVPHAEETHEAFIASDSALWLLDSGNVLLHTSTIGSPVWRHKVLPANSYSFVAALGDTLWIRYEVRHPRSGDHEKRVTKFVRQAHSLHQLGEGSASAVPPRRGERVAVYRSGWEDDVWQALPGEKTRLRFTAEGVEAVNATGQVLGRYIEPQVSICAVRRRGSVYEVVSKQAVCTTSGRRSRGRQLGAPPKP